MERFSVNSEAATGPLDPARGSAPMINRSRLAPPPHRANTFRLHACTFPLEWETLARSQNDFAQIDKRERGKEWLSFNNRRSNSLASKEILLSFVSPAPTTPIFLLALWHSLDRCVVDIDYFESSRNFNSEIEGKI